MYLVHLKRNIHLQLAREGFLYTNRLDFLDDMYEHCYYKFEEYPTYIQLIIRYHPTILKPFYYIYHKEDVTRFREYEAALVAETDRLETIETERIAAENAVAAEAERQRIISEYFPWYGKKIKPLKPFSRVGRVI